MVESIAAEHNEAAADEQTAEKAEDRIPEPPAFVETLKGWQEELEKDVSGETRLSDIAAELENTLTEMIEDPDLWQSYPDIATLQEQLSSLDGTDMQKKLKAMVDEALPYAEGFKIYYGPQGVFAALPGGETRKPIPGILFLPPGALSALEKDEAQLLGWLARIFDVNGYKTEEEEGEDSLTRGRFLNLANLQKSMAMLKKSPQFKAIAEKSNFDEMAGKLQGLTRTLEITGRIFNLAAMEVYVEELDNLSEFSSHTYDTEHRALAALREATEKAKLTEQMSQTRLTGALLGNLGSGQIAVQTPFPTGPGVGHIAGIPSLTEPNKVAGFKLNI